MKKINIKISKRYLKDLIITIMLGITLSIVILSFFRITTINGHSMDNTLYDGQRLILSMKSYSFGKTPEYKDVIVFERKDLSTRYLVKRVIGVAGDRVAIKDNQLYINNKLINEDYIKEPMNMDDLDIVVPEGKVFVMGDNRNNSIDSRKCIIGFVDIEDEICGKVLGV